MKRPLIVAQVCCLSLILYFSAPGQKWGGDVGFDLHRKYSIGVHGGFLSYFGDLSRYDGEPLNKIKNESGPAFGITATKHFSDKYGISGQILYGAFRGSSGSMKFHTRVLEYNLHFRADLVRIVFPQKEHRFSFNPYAGIGQFFFDARIEQQVQELMTIRETRSQVPEFVFFGGAALGYAVIPAIVLQLDVGLRQCRNDKLDGMVKNDNFDYYTYTSLGANYTIQYLGRKPLRNKARIAHAEPFLQTRGRIR